MMKDIDLSNGIRLTKNYKISYGRLLLMFLITLGLFSMIMLQSNWEWSPAAIAVWTNMGASIKREVHEADTE